MGKLTNILQQIGSLGEIQAAWDSANSAGDFDVVPKAEYIADITQGEAIVSRSNSTPGYRLTFEIVEGPYTGYRLWLDCWLTSKAMHRSKRDLGKLGVTSLEQLERPLPAVYRCNVKVVLRRDDEGEERNRIQRFEVLEAIPHMPDEFKPMTATASGGGIDDDSTQYAAAADFPEDDDKVVLGSDNDGEELNRVGDFDLLDDLVPRVPNMSACDDLLDDLLSPPGKREGGTPR
ncbi:DUF669 domain-containing protein [Aureliella helgolandensis]|uniref:DUF669 domain-containing protein n=1 Tax=Aureliella helgolandensis TaxID=2527968 RepID=A0A518G9T3_9BACT|nr:DUF669 domain-containing protein [Aureliella helgolandensis]QDV25333.1 hypothetical protein Q31a_36570 [Aureliella helgolandensis]